MKLKDIKENDILVCNNGYCVVVRKNKQNELYGQLICHPKDSCSKIPYALNKGVGYTKILSKIDL